MLPIHSEVHVLAVLEGAVEGREREVKAQEGTGAISYGVLDHKLVTDVVPLLECIQVSIEVSEIVLVTYAPPFHRLLRLPAEALD